VAIAISCSTDSRYRGRRNPSLNTFPALPRAASCPVALVNSTEWPASADRRHDERTVRDDDGIQID
jgi:hypothetical protein